MSASRSLPLRAIFKVWRELVLPDDFEDSNLDFEPPVLVFHHQRKRGRKSKSPYQLVRFRNSMDSPPAMALGASSSWSRAMLQISPYTFAALGIAIAIGVSVLGAAWGCTVFGC